LHRRPVIACLASLVAFLSGLGTAWAALPPGAKRVRVGNVRLAYRATGHGPTLLLINGSGATLDTWDPALLRRFGRRRRVIVFDPRGLGASTSRGHRVSVRQDADDAAGLLRRLHVRRADVLGWSYGGYVAQEVALRHRRALRRLVLVSTDFGGAHAVLTSRRWADLDDKATRGEASPAELLELLFPPEGRDAGAAWFARLFAQPGGCCEPVSPQAGQAVVESEDRWHAPGAGTRSRLRGLRVPTLIGAGAKDVDIPAVNARLLHRRIAHSRLVVYRRAGHAFIVQEQADFARRVLRFLRGRH
jgi:pimeloyl-ACP methyl ester carboxylesterase